MRTVRLSIGIVLLAVSLMLAACDSTPTSPLRRVGSLDTGTAYAVSVLGDRAFVATNDGVVVADIQQRDHPEEIARIELSQSAFGVVAQDGRVYIAGPGDGLVIADIQDARIVGVYPGGGINALCIRDDVAYASTQQGDLQIVDVADPTQPSLLGHYAGQGGRGMMVACLDGVVYFSSANSGLTVLDVADPSAVRRVTTVSRTQGANDHQVVGDRLYLACHGNGVRILDIADPRHPRTIASFNDGGEAWGVGGDANTLWVGDLQEGVKLYDLSDPRSPALVAQDEGGMRPMTSSSMADTRIWPTRTGASSFWNTPARRSHDRAGANHL